MLMRIRMKLPEETAARKTIPRTPLVPFDMANFVQKDSLLNVTMKTKLGKTSAKSINRLSKTKNFLVFLFLNTTEVTMQVRISSCC